MDTSTKNFASARRRWLLAPVLAVLAIGLIACDDDDNDTDTDTGAGVATPTAVITATPTEGADVATETPTADATPTSEPDADVGEDQIGQNVTVRGEVDTIYSDRLFSVSGDEILGLFGGNTTLIIVQSDAGFDTASLEEGRTVEVTGTGVRLVVEDIEGETGLGNPFTDEEASAVEDFDDGDVGVLADSVTLGD